MVTPFPKLEKFTMVLSWVANTLIKFIYSDPTLPKFLKVPVLNSVPRAAKPLLTIPPA